MYPTTSFSGHYYETKCVPVVDYGNMLLILEFSYSNYSLFSLGLLETSIIRKIMSSALIDDIDNGYKQMFSK